MEAEKILSELGITDDVIAIYPYGSQVYGTADSKSDYDYIIVTKSSMLPSGAFKNNAITSKDWMTQGTLYSRGGFLDAINNYDVVAMECLSLKDKDVILKEFPFNLPTDKWDEKVMIKKIISKASASRHIANQQAKTGYTDRAKKGMFHALRILNFGLQLKEHEKIVDFGVCNELYFKFKSIDQDDYDTRDYFEMFDNLLEKLRG